MVSCRGKFYDYLNKVDTITKSKECSSETQKQKHKLFFDEKQELPHASIDAKVFQVR